MITEKKNKEIIYNNIERFAVIVADDTYRGLRYICVNRGIHPCAYVLCPQDFLDKHVSKEYNTIEGIYVHGGISFIGNANELLGMEDIDYPCFGWDYGHAGDWAGYISERDNIIFEHQKYTTEMLVKDCKSAIDQYFEILNADVMKDDPNPFLTRDLLKKNGFVSILGGLSDDEDAYKLMGSDDGYTWTIFIDFKSPNNSYAITKNPRRKYEGEIMTLNDLNAVIELFKLPVEIKR